MAVAEGSLVTDAQMVEFVRLLVDGLLLGSFGAAVAGVVLTRVVLAAAEAFFRALRARGASKPFPARVAASLARHEWAVRVLRRRIERESARHG